jgi:hypothetical protein
MSKLTISQREDLKRLVLDCIIQRLTTQETKERIHHDLQLDISFDYLAHLKASLKNDIKKQLEHLQKDRYALVGEVFFNRRDELIQLQRSLHSIVCKNKDKDPDVAIRAISKLHELSHSIHQLYEGLPAYTENINTNSTTMINIPTATTTNTTTATKKEEEQYNTDKDKESGIY